jgi:hypothetical protein
MRMELRTAHTLHARLPHVSRGRSLTHALWGRYPCGSTWSCHLGVLLLWCRTLQRFASVDLRHAAHSSASKSWVLVAVSPAVHRALDQSTLASQAWVELCKRPADCVTLRLVHQAVTAVLVFRTAGARVHAVLRLELGAECFHIDRLHVTTNSVLHLDTISRVFERNPLYTISVLSHNEWGGSGNRARGCVGVDRAVRNIVVLHRWPLLLVLWVLWMLRVLRWAQRS